MSSITPAEVDGLVAEITAAKKYRDMDLVQTTVRDLFDKELALNHPPKEAIKAVKKKLHNIVAPYLGDPDYPVAALALEQACATHDPQTIRDACSAILKTHASTHERLPIMDRFYSSLFAVTGKPATILDLACGLHPFSFPWMDLPASTAYYAYDIHRPRVRLINNFFELMNMRPLSSARDILIDPPAQSADVAFFFKEAHRFEQRQRGCNRAFWQALNVRWLLVSLPTSSLSGKHDLVDRQRRLVGEALEGLPWPVTEVLVATELVFCIHKG